MTKGTFGKPGWFNAVKLEYQACKERVCLADMSSFTKVEVKVMFLSHSRYLVNQLGIEKDITDCSNFLIFTLCTIISNSNNP